MLKEHYFIRRTIYCRPDRFSHYTHIESYEEEVSKEDFFKRLTEKECEKIINNRCVERYSPTEGYTTFFTRDDCDLFYEKIYNELCENRLEWKKADKIIAGIKDGKINKDNLYEQVAIMTKQVKSKQSLDSWNKITEWFANTEWVIE